MFEKISFVMFSTVHQGSAPSQEGENTKHIRDGTGMGYVRSLFLFLMSMALAGFVDYDTILLSAGSVMIRDFLMRTYYQILLFEIGTVTLYATVIYQSNLAAVLR